MVQLAKVSMKWRPSGELRLRLIPVDSPTAKAAGATLSIGSYSKAEEKGSENAGFGVLAKGVRNFTSFARGVIRDCAVVLEEKYGLECWFITLTLPGSTRDALEACAAWSAYLMERVRQFLRDNGFPNEVIAVWELQRRGALHMHLAVPRIQGESTCPVPFGLHHLWCSLLESISKKCGVDMFERAKGGTWRYQWSVVRTDIQKTQKSVARYLSKYISKGSVNYAKKMAFYPTRWWSASRTLSQMALKATRLLVSPTMPISESGDLFERVSGTIGGAAVQIYQIANAYQPTSRCLSMWGCTPEAVREFFTHSKFFLPRTDAEWYDSEATNETEGASASPDAPSHFCWVVLDYVERCLSPPCTSVVHR